MAGRQGKYPGLSVFRHRGKWHAQSSYYDDNGKRWYLTARHDDERTAVQNLLKKQIARGASGGALGATRTPVFKELFDQWLVEKRTLGAQDSTLNAYRTNINKHITPTFGKRRVGTITGTELNKHFYETLANIGQSARAQTYRILRTFFNWATKHEHIKSNPLDKVSAPKSTRTVRDNDEKYIDKRTNIYRYAMKWVSEPNNPYHDYYPMFMFMGLGLRASELLGLTWDCVSNLNNNKQSNLTIHQQLAKHHKAESGLTGDYIKPRTKTGETRVIPLTKLWKDALLEQQAKQRKATKPGLENLIWVNDKGHHITQRALGTVWRNMLNDYINHNRKDKKPLTETEYFRPHAVRHITVSLMSQQGIPIETVQKITGHTDKEMTLYYRHISRTETQNATDTLGKAYEQIRNTNNG